MPPTQRLARYLAGWQVRRPAAVVSLEYLHRKTTPQVAVHRKVFLGGPGLVRSGPLLAQNAWGLGRWRIDGRPAALAMVPERMIARTSHHLGISASTIRRRLDYLARRHAVPPRDAVRYGLVQGDGATRWADYVFDHELGWNASASWSSGIRHARVLADKIATGALLESVDLPTAPTIEVPALPSQVDWSSRAEEWLSRWPTVHGKRRVGSRGVGAFELARDESVAGRLALRPYQQAATVPEPAVWLNEHVAGHAYLIQPRLVTHPMFDAIADPTDVVTIRIVTRDRGGGPAVFCAWVEVPLPIVGPVQYYLLADLDESGQIGGLAVPEWLRPDPNAPEAEVRPTPSEERSANVASRLQGLRVPDYAAAAAGVLRAHRRFAGLFAVGWDLAVTADGNVVLEGNVGFGVAAPQVIAGGLLAGLGSAWTSLRR